MTKYFLLFFIAVTSSCKTAQQNLQSQTPLEALCFCENSNGEKISTEIKSHQEREQISDTELGHYLLGEVQKGNDSWLWKDFLEDERFMSNLKKASSRLNENKDAAMEQEFQRLEKENPACFNFFMISPMILKSSGNQ
jgi:hypothetical protein